jgi:hypothetical protein
VKRLSTNKAIPTGTIVMVKDMTRKDKMQPPFVGPYMVMRSNPSGSYTLKDAAGGLFHRDVTRHQLKVVTSDAFADDFNSAQYVSRLSDHKVIDGRLHYLTHFSGFPDPEWVPEENIDDKDLIRQYLALKKVIPASLKSLRSIQPKCDPILSSHSKLVAAAKDISEISPSASTDKVTPAINASAVASSSSAELLTPTRPSGDLQRHHRQRTPSRAVLDSGLALLAHQTCPFFPNVQDLF